MKNEITTRMLFISFDTVTLSLTALQDAQTPTNLLILYLPIAKIGLIINTHLHSKFKQKCKYICKYKLEFDPLPVEEMLELSKI